MKNSQNIIIILFWALEIIVMYLGKLFLNICRIFGKIIDEETRAYKDNGKYKQ